MTSNGIIGFVSPASNGLGFQSVFFSILFAAAERFGKACCVVPSSYESIRFYSGVNGLFLSDILPKLGPFRLSQADQQVLALSSSNRVELSLLAIREGWVKDGVPVTAIFYEDIAEVMSVADPVSSLFGRSFVLFKPGTIEREESLRRMETNMPLMFVGVTPSLIDMTMARQAIVSLMRWGKRRDQIHAVLLNEGCPGGLDGQLLVEECGSPIVTFPFDRVCLQAENQIKPIQVLQPRGRWADLIGEFVSFIAKEFEPKAQNAADVKNEERASLDSIKRIVASRLWVRLAQSDDLKGINSSVLDSLLEAEFQTALGEFKPAALEPAGLKELRDAVKADILGLGPLEKMLKDDAITEIMINGCDRLFVERQGSIEPVSETFLSDAQVRVVIDRMVAETGRRVDGASPMCDLRLKDGSRVNIIIPPISLQGPVITIRRFKEHFLSMEDLIREGTLSKEEAGRLIECVRRRNNIVVAGNSGSGKTTLLNVLSGYIEDNERILTLEDAAELKIQKKHVVRLETRPKNAEGYGRISMTDLVVNTLRMRPDRIVVGECRGPEIIPMLQAMNTGHDGCMTTLHSNSAQDAIQRLESLALLGAPQWPIQVVRRQIETAIDVVVFLKRMGSRRKLMEMGNVVLKDQALIIEEFAKAAPPESLCR